MNREINIDDDYDDGYDEIDEQERKEQEEDDLVFNCRCGAYIFNSKGKFLHVSDCIC